MKHRLRMEMKATLARMSAEEMGAAAESACARLTGLEEFAAADLVMLYWPIPGEVDCMPALFAAWEAGKTVLLPKVLWEEDRMIALAYRSPDEELTVGRYGIYEPADGSPWPIDEIDLIVAPALAYDRMGNRLGRGGGFYDRFLAQIEVGVETCGLAYDQQVVEELPTHSNDYPVDILVTDREVLRFRHRPADRQLDLFAKTAGKTPTGKEPQA